VHVRPAGALNDSREANGFLRRLRHGSYRRSHPAVLPATLAGRAQLPSAQNAQRRKNPKDDRRQPAKRKSAKSKDREYNRQDCEDDGHDGILNLIYAQRAFTPWG
jgi:hypothetical protein